MKNVYTKVLLSCFFVVWSVASLMAQSFHTVSFTGNASDFNTAEKFTDASGTIDYYITFDAGNLYVGAFRTSGTFASDNALTVYVDSDPKTSAASSVGSQTGAAFDGVTPSFTGVFKPDYTAKVRKDLYCEARRYTSSWASTTTPVNYVNTSTNNALELSMPLANMVASGTPSALYVVVYMNYTNGVYANAPGATVAASTTPSYSNYFGGFGVSSAGCNPKTITNLPIIDLITNAAPADNVYYGKVVVNQAGTLVASGGVNKGFFVTSGGSIQIQSTGGLDLNAMNCLMQNGTTINSTGSGNIIDGTNQGPSVCSVVWKGLGFVTGNTISIENTQIAGGVDFGTNTTIFTNSHTNGGYLDIRVGGYIANAKPPTYGTGSNLRYSVGRTASDRNSNPAAANGSYTRADEWKTNATSGVGVPYNVVFSKSSVGLQGAISAGDSLVMLGNFLMNGSDQQLVSMNSMTGKLCIGGDLTVDNLDSIRLSNSSGGDIAISGNINFLSGGKVNHNNRAFFFRGANTQSINVNGSAVAGTANFHYWVFQKTGGEVQLNSSTSNVFVMSPLGGQAIQWKNATSLLNLNGKVLGVYGAIGSAPTGSGLKSSSTSSQLFLYDSYANTGIANGRIMFVSGFQTIGYLLTTKYGSNGTGKFTLGSDLTITGNNNGMQLGTGSKLQFDSAAARNLYLTYYANTQYNGIIDMSFNNLAHGLHFNGAGNFGNPSNIIATSGGLIQGSGANASTVYYDGVAPANTQVIFNTYPYNNLTLAGSGVKQISNNTVTVVNKLDIQSIDTLELYNNSAALSLSATSTLKVGSTAVLRFLGQSFPNLIPRANINLVSGSYVMQAGEGTFSTEPIYSYLVLARSGGGNNSFDPIIPTTGPGGFTTLTVNNDLQLNNYGTSVYQVRIPTGYTFAIAGNLTTTRFIGGTATLGDSVNAGQDAGTIQVGGNSNTCKAKFAIQNGLFEYNGSSTQTIKPTAYGNLKLSGGGDKVIETGTSGYLTVKDKCYLKLNGARLLVGSNTLYLLTNRYGYGSGTATANVSASDSVIAGTAFSNTNCIVTNDSGYVRVYKEKQRFKYVLPLSAGSFYNPVTVNQYATATLTTPATSINIPYGTVPTNYIQFRATNNTTPNRYSANTINSYWKVSSGGYTSIAPSLTFGYEDGQIAGSEAIYKGGLYNATWVRKGLPVDITVDTMFAHSGDSTTYSLLNGGSTYAIGEPGAFQTIAIVYYYSRASGNWSSATTWSNVALGGAAASTAPPNTLSNIVVGNNNTVTLDVTTVTSITSLDIQSAGKLDLGTNSQSGLSIGTFTMSTGSGTLALGAASGTAIFPTVATNSFNSATGATLEWNGTGNYTLPSSITAAYNLAFSGSGTRTFGASITVGNNYTTSGTVTVVQGTLTGNRSGGGGTLILGSGTTLRVAAQFPANFTTFVSTGSTVDYYGTTGNGIEPKNYHNLTISGNRGGNNIQLNNNVYPSSYIGIAGTFTPSATNYTGVSSTNNNGDFVFNGTGSQTVPPFNYCLSVHVLTRSSGTVTFSNTADGTGNTNIQCNTNGYGFDFAALTGTGTYDFSASTLEMMGAFNGTHTFRSTPTGANYNNLIVNKASGYTPAYSVSTNTLRINGTLSVLNGPDFDVSAGQLTMGTGSAIALTSGRILKSSAGNGITLNNCNITIGTGSTWETGYGTVAITTTGSLTLNGSGRMGNYNPTTNNSDVTLGSLNVPTGATAGLSPAILLVNGATQITGALTLAGTTQDKTFAGNFTLDGSFTNTVTGSTLFGGNFTINNGSTFTQGSSAYAFSGTGKTIGGTIATALSFSNASVSGTVTNNLTNGLTFTSNLGGIGTLTQGTNSILTLQGNCTPTISGAASGNIVNVSGASPQTIPTGSFQNLVLSGGNKSASDTVRIIGQLTLSSGLGTVAPTNRYVRMLNGSTLIKNGGNWTSNAPKVWNNEQYNLTVSTATTPGMEFGLLAENPINNLSITAASPVLLPVSVNASGTLNIATGSVLGINGKTLYLKTGISGAGTISGSSTSNLDFYGTGAYGTIPFTSGAAELNRLKVNRTSTGSVTLGTDVQIDSGAVLVNGTLNTGANKVVLLPAAMLSEVDNASQLLGTVQVTRTIGVTNFININGIGMQLSANSSMGSTVISRVTGTALNGNAPNTPCCGMNTSLKRYYDITPTNNSNLGVFLKLNYLTQELNGQPEVAFAMYKASLPYNNSNPGWSQIRAIYNAGAKQVSNVVAIQSFSRFTLSSEFAGPLPVTLSSFSARLQGKDASIKWATLSEEGVKFFNVERSSDGKTYSQIVSKPAIGSVNSETDYTTVDQGVTGLAAAELYYRLRVINMDGSQTVSDPVSINLRKTAGTGGVSLFPNPTADGSSVLKISTSDASVRIVISDISGKAVSTVDQPLASGSLELPLALPANAPAGSYMVSVQGETLHKNLILVYRK